MAATTYPDPTLEWETEQPAITLDAQSALKSLRIANRLKFIGDKLQQQHGEDYLSGIITPFIMSSVPTVGVGRIISALNDLRRQLQQVGKVFSHAYHLIETLSLEVTEFLKALE